MPSSSTIAATPRRPLRRLALELSLIVLAKVAVLTAIWWLAIAPHPRPDTRPAAIERLLAPAAANSVQGPP